MGRVSLNLKSFALENLTILDGIKPGKAGVFFYFETGSLLEGIWISLVKNDVPRFQVGFSQ